MYQNIRSRQTPLESYTQQSVSQGVLTQDDVAETSRRIKQHLEEELGRARDKDRAKTDLGGLWKGLHISFDPAAVDYPTRVDIETLRSLGQALLQVPEPFQVHRKLERILGRRREMLEGTRPLDWAMGEALAFASLLAEHQPIRLTGQDSGRGTFSHRHAVLHDQNTGETFVGLNHLGVPQATFEVYNSPLSEAAALGFEYGYTLVRPDALVLWEAQFGDFANGAQVLIDQFVCSSEAKWNRCSALVMLLPHGYEGMGPEHSSARLERYLQLSGDDNWRIMNLTTPAQLFHALRGQLRCTYRKPLILMTPKSLLRHPKAVSTLSAFSGGYLHPILDDPTEQKERVRRVVLCSGKVYYDLLKTREELEEQRVALVRVEQLYPFCGELLAEILASYPSLEDVVWCQEEPKNMGSWTFVAPEIQAATGWVPQYSGRPRAASPATGSKHLHVQEQQGLVHDALRLADSA